MEPIRNFDFQFSIEDPSAMGVPQIDNRKSTIENWNYLIIGETQPEVPVFQVG